MTASLIAALFDVEVGLERSVFRNSIVYVNAPPLPELVSSRSLALLLLLLVLPDRDPALAEEDEESSSLSPVRTLPARPPLAEAETVPLDPLIPSSPLPLEATDAAALPPSLALSSCAPAVALAVAGLGAAASAAAKSAAVCEVKRPFGSGG